MPMDPTHPPGGASLAGGVDPAGTNPYVPGRPRLPGPVATLTQAQLLAIGEGVLPDNYVRPLEDPGPGYELLQAHALQNARAADAVANSGAGMFFLSAQGGARARVTVELSRPAGPALPAVVVKAGSRFATEHGQEFVLLYDVAFTGADVGPHNAQLEALRPGWEWNVRGERTTAAGETLPGEISTRYADGRQIAGITRLVEDPEWGDTTIVVTQVNDATGGRAEMLDALAADRGMSRLAAEADDAFCYRTRMLPDVVTPAAIWRAVFSYMAPLSNNWSIVETWEPSLQMCYDMGPNLDDPSNPDNAIHMGTFVYDAAPTDRYCNVWLDEVEQTGAFIVVLPFLPSGVETSMVFDDTLVLEAEYQSSIGWRAVGAFDMPETAVETMTAPQGCYDGDDFGNDGAYAGLWKMLQAIKGGGIAVGFERW